MCDTGTAQSSKRLVLPSLVLSRAASQPPSLITMVLLIEIGQTFDVPIGVAGQLHTVTSILSVITGLLMGFLAIRFSYKTLLLIGLAVFGISAFGSYLSSTFTVLLLSYSIVGVATAMVGPMAGTLIGTTLPVEKRARAISWSFMGMAFTVFITAPAIGFIANQYGWQLVFLWIALPIALLAFVLVYRGIPDPASAQHLLGKRVDVRGSFKRIFTHRSAVSCLLCVILVEATWVISGTYGLTYVREIGALPPAEASLLLFGTSTFFAVGSYLGGLLVNRLGRRRVVILSAFLLGVVTVFYFNMPVYGLIVVSLFLACIFASMRYTASESLVLEQIPDLRGSMMSLNSVALNIGKAIGAGLGGFLLLSYGYFGLGLLGLLSILSVGVYYVYAVDPTLSRTRIEYGLES